MGARSSSGLCCADGELTPDDFRFGCSANRKSKNLKSKIAMGINAKFQSPSTLSGPALWAWRVAQGLVWVVGFALFLALVFAPKIGAAAFWNVLIPVAPALFVLATGVWRNICPLGTVSLLPRHLGISRSRRLPLEWQGKLHLAGVCLLFLIVPLRHIWLNTNGLATAGVLVVLALAAFTMGYFFEWKSGWCSSLCPVHPVERLYGEKVLFSPPNAHCGQCHNCVIPCPDSTPGMTPMAARARRSQRMASCLLVGGLPGFVWGWFHVPDFSGGALTTQHFLTAYGWPLAGMAATLAAFSILSRRCQPEREPLLTSVFAAAAVSCYYWYRLPSLLGFGLFPGDGMLVDLRGALTESTVFALKIAATAFFGWWLVGRKPAPAVWAMRPPFEKAIKKISQIS